MHFLGIGTATPATRYSKSQCLAAFADSAWYARLDLRAHWLTKTVLQRDNGIESRHLSVDSLDQVFTQHAGAAFHRPRAGARRPKAR
mgnify:CR=1 FL=1